MGFVRKGFNRALNCRKGITIKPVHRFEDLGPGDAFPYSYSQNGQEIEFRAINHEDWRQWTSYNGSELVQVHTATYIVERSVNYGTLTSRHLYQDLKRTITDGMFALMTRGGFHLRVVPEFRVEFVDAQDSVPRRQPRPIDLQAIQKASISEKPLLLGDNKNNEFVYEDYGAADIEKKITIARIGKLEEIGLLDPAPYVYSQGDFMFEFRAAQYREWKSDAGRLTRPHTATYVIEESIRTGIILSGRRLSIPSEQLELRRNLKEGMWVAENHGVPGFRLEFVERAADVPKSPPLPSN